MTTVVTPNLVIEHQPHQFSAEARELGLRPGEWPTRLTTAMGNGLHLIRTSKKIDAEGDILWVMNEYKDYTIMIEAEISGKRFTRTLIATDETDAVRRAHRSLASEPEGYYVLFARLA